MKVQQLHLPLRLTLQHPTTQLQTPLPVQAPSHHLSQLQRLISAPNQHRAQTTQPPLPQTKSHLRLRLPQTLLHLLQPLPVPHQLLHMSSHLTSRQ